MFTATDTALMNAIFKLGDRPDRLIYGLLNTIDDPAKPTKSGKPRKTTPISIEIFHRSQTDKLTLSYDYFRPATAPAGFLPEFSTIDVKKYSGGKGPPVAVHIHHKFIVIDGDTTQPTIYTGSANFSKNSENNNDENLLEISGNATLAQVYVAEFLRLYNHYRARALWNRSHPPHAGAGAAKSTARRANGAGHDPLVLASTRDGWIKGAYKSGTKEYVARERLL
jgi:phosphatidylserine/phosphatidylglycerophosphate/cardiolipin synthase-like enzyme